MNVMNAKVLDEIIDYGYPQILEVDVLKKYITQGGAKNIDLNDQEQLKKITVQATGVCSWRAEGIKHRKNEVFIDVIEKVNILMSTKRERLRADVSGEILVNCKLSGMPECKFGMNDKLIMTAEARARSSDKGIALDDYRFHQCVRLSKFDVDREITFIPPDEPFQLMTYRITENIESPFKLLPNVKVLGRSRLELSLQVTAMYDRNIEATNVRIDFPCPKNTAKAHIPNTAHGKARFDPAQGAVVWRIRRFPGRHEYNLLAEVELASTITDKQWVRHHPGSLGIFFEPCITPFLETNLDHAGWHAFNSTYFQDVGHCSLDAMVNYDKNVQGAKREQARQAHEAKVKAKQDKEAARREAAKAKRDAAGLKILELADALRQVLAPAEEGYDTLQFPQFLDLLRENAVADSTAVSKFLETCRGHDSVAKTECAAHALHEKWDVLLHAVMRDLEHMLSIQEMFCKRLHFLRQQLFFDFVQICKKLSRCARLLQFLEGAMAVPMGEAAKEDLPALSGKDLKQWKALSEDISARLQQQPGLRGPRQSQQEEPFLSEQLEAIPECSSGGALDSTATGS
eukprot:s712_g7.t1